MATHKDHFAFWPSEVQTLINALDFYHAFHTGNLDSDTYRQYRLAFQEDDAQLVDQLADRFVLNFRHTNV